jgi:hypothetical protein
LKTYLTRGSKATPDSRREDYRNNSNNLNLILTQFLGTLLGQKRILFDSGNESS